MDSVKSFSYKLAPGQKVVVEDMTVGQLADRLGSSANNLIVELLKQGIVANKNQLVKKDKIIKLLDHLEVPFVEQEYREDVSTEKLIEARFTSGEEQRLPVVSVVGHVDHGKTSLLDYLRKAKVAEKEKGGITQHVSAYEVETSLGNIVFLDTPGHEAFSLMRERGVLLSDLVVLIVALDDGVKPQTVESIKKIQEFGATTVVALNKADKVKADRLDIVKRQLADYGLLPDDWGGDVPTVAVSAKTGQGVDELLEVIRLQADILDLKTSLDDPAQGFVLESMIEKGRGAVASVILHRGKICKGDSFICGKSFGRVSSMHNYLGRNVDCVGPSVPVRIAGFSDLPQAGDVFKFATSAQIKKHKSVQKKSTTIPNKAQYISVEKIEGTVSIIVKAETQLSKEAVVTSLKKIGQAYDDRLKIIDVGIGSINEGNLDLAITTNSIIYGLGARLHKGASSKKLQSVDIRTFDIIYKLLEDVEDTLERTKVKQVIETQIGMARVKAIFNIKSVGIVAGAAVESGSLQKGLKAKIYRNEELVGSGTIKTLQKERSAASSISAGNDCAFSVEGFSAWKIGDIVHCFTEKLS